MSIATRPRTLAAAPISRDTTGRARAAQRSRRLLTVAATALALGACAGPPSVGVAPTVTHTVATQSVVTQPVTSQSVTTQPGTPSVSAPAGSPTATAKASAGASRDEPGTAFTAFGVRTPWRAVVSGGVLATEGPGLGEHRVAVRREAFARGVDFTGTEPAAAGATGSRAEAKVTLTVRSQSCRDAQGRDTGLLAVLSVGDRQLIGCAVEGASVQAPT